MSTLQDKRDRALAVAKGMKESKVSELRRRRKLPETDLYPIIEGWRGDQPVVAMITQQIDRDKALAAARAAAVAFGCDAVTMVMESWHGVEPYNENSPLTGKRWAPGEMQVVVEKHNGLERGWMTEGLNIISVNRAGDAAMSVVDYKIVQHEGPTRLELIWAEDRSGEMESIGGRVVDVLLAAMEHSSAGQLVERAGISPAQFGLSDPEEIQAHMDCAAVKALRAGGFEGAVMLTGKGSEVRRRVIEESFGREELEQWGFTRMDDQ